MITNIDDAIAETQSILQSLFSKPKLSNKLLKKPPFRFIHDIVTATLNSTGFPDGLYSKEELDSNSYKDKESKMIFLERLVSLVTLYLDSPLSVRSSKIISGIDPINTNIFLAGFGRAATDSSCDRFKLISRCIRENKVDNVAESTHKISSHNGFEEDKQNSKSRKQNTTSSAVTKENEIIEDRNGKISTTADITHQIDSCNTDFDRTRLVLEHIVPRPKCSEKLLRKPPFRFLHDLIMAVNRKTGFCLDVLSEDETDAKNINDKQSKITFLNKIIKKVEFFLELAIEANPKKIIYGVEPEKTCLLLQLFALAATTHHSNSNISLGTKEPLLNSYSINSDDENKHIVHNGSDTKKDGEILVTTMELEESTHSAENKDSKSPSYNLSTEKLTLDTKKGSQNSDVDTQVRCCDSDPKRTREMVEHIVLRPKCTDKLLSKPPFRFLRDLILAIGKATGFGLDIYSDEELDSSNMKDKPSKILFLQKLKKHIQLTLNIEIDLNPNKTVSGLEADKVCTFLQFFVVAATTASQEYDKKSNGNVLSSLNHLDTDGAEKATSYSGSAKNDDTTKENLEFSALEQTMDQLDDHNNEMQTDSLDRSNVVSNDSAVDEARVNPNPTYEIDSSVVVRNTDTITEEKNNVSNEWSSSIKNRIKSCTTNRETTREMVEQVVQMPKCNDRLLSKPPFRFLYDLIMAIRNKTGFGNDIYSDETDSSNFDKEAKIKFLDNTIRKVESSLKIDIDVKPSKIVSGLEAEKTCKFLQLLVIASTKSVEGSSMIKVEKSPEYETPMSTNLEREALTEETLEVTEDNEKVDHLMDDTNSSTDQIMLNESETNDLNNGPQLCSMRPKTARRRPPRTKKENNVVEAKYKSFSETKAAIIKDGNHKNDNVQEENSEQYEFLIDNQNQSSSTIKQKDESNNKNEEDNSTKEQNETQEARNSGIRLHLNIKKSKETTLSANSMYTSNGFTSILQGIQNLVKYITPLGKSMENVHDTYGQMIKEEHYWISEYQKYTEELEREKKKTDDTLEPLYQKLRNMEDQLYEKRQQVLEVKINIERNDIRLRKYLETIVKQ